MKKRIILERDTLGNYDVKCVQEVHTEYVEIYSVKTMFLIDNIIWDTPEEEYGDNLPESWIITMYNVKPGTEEDSSTYDRIGKILEAEFNHRIADYTIRFWTNEN